MIKQSQHAVSADAIRKFPNEFSMDKLCWKDAKGTNSRNINPGFCLIGRSYLTRLHRRSYSSFLVFTPQPAPVFFGAYSPLRSLNGGFG